MAVGAISFGLPCISQSRNSRLCLAGNATSEKMHSLGSLLDLCVSKTPPAPRRSSPGFSVRWSAACTVLDNPNKADSFLLHP